MSDDGASRPIKVFATLFDPATGVRRTVRDEHSGEDGADYMWTEGNYACDCNRRLFLARAGAPGYSEDHTPCGDTIKLESLKLEDGRDLLAVPPLSRTAGT